MCKSLNGTLKIKQKNDVKQGTSVIDEQDHFSWSVTGDVAIADAYFTCRMTKRFGDCP